MHKVLLVDDEELVRNAISKMIDWKSLGCEVIATARNGSEAYQNYLDLYPEIIITDLLMPVMNGIEFMERIREKDKDVKVIVLSGYGEFEYAQKAIRLGASDYILKPVSVENMSALISRCVSEIEADNTKKFIKGDSVDFFRIVILEMLNSPDDIENILNRYMLGKFSYGGAVVVSCTFKEGQERMITSVLNSFSRKYSLDIPIPPIMAGNSIHCLYVAENLDSYSRIQDEIQSWGYANGSYNGGIVESFRYLISQIAMHKEFIMFTEDGRRSRFSNEAVYMKRILMISDKFRKLLESSSHGEIMQDICKAMSELALDDAKAIFLRLLISLDNMDFQSGMTILQNASTVDEICLYLQGMLSRSISKTAVDDDGPSYPVRRIKDYINQHYTDEWLSLKSIAKDVMFMDAAYLSKLFHRETGIRFSDYVNQMRVEKAKELMSIYHKSLIFEIAEEVGFGNNPRYFSQVFRKYTGISPSDYIRMAEKEKTRSGN